MKKLVCVLAIIGLVSLMATHGFAGAIFSDDFNGDGTTGSASSNWNNQAAADYSGFCATFNGTSYRNYIYTVDVDYASTDFIATVELTNGDGAWGGAFFGLGTGTTSGQGDPAWGEPKDGSYVYMRYNGGGFSSSFMNLLSDDANEIQSTEANLAAATTIRVQLSWDESEKTATFSVDTDITDGDDAFDDAVYSITNDNLGETGTTARLFLGGSDNAIADNFSVTAAVPEPSTFALLIAGLVGMAMTVRRKK